MLYTQLFQELYYQADFKFGGKLPLDVTLMLDEFANVALPDDFCSLLSTMRSRRISAIIIIQNLAQIKALFKEPGKQLQVTVTPLYILVEMKVYARIYI